jgi:hypothetical protein
LGESPTFESFADVEGILQREGDVLFEEEGMLLAWSANSAMRSRPDRDRCPQWAATSGCRSCSRRNRRRWRRRDEPKWSASRFAGTI